MNKYNIWFHEDLLLCMLSSLIAAQEIVIDFLKVQ